MSEKNKQSSSNNLIVLTDKQEIARRMMMEDNHYASILFDGGSRAGKSWVIIIVIILFCIQYPGLRVLISRRTFNSGKRYLWMQTLIPVLDKMKIIYDENKTDYIVKIGKSEIWLGGLDNKDRIDKILGSEFGLIFLNEATEVSKSSRDVVLTRLAQNIKGFNNFIIYDCNPHQPTHYLYKEFYVEKDSTRGKLKFLPKDNIKYLPKGYIKNILMKLPKDKQARFLKGEWLYLPGAVYNNIREDHKIDCDKNIYSYDDIAIGIDWGLHTACTIWGFKITPDIIQAYCIHEIIILGGTTDNLITELDKVYGIKEENHILYCDHEPDRILKLENAGYMAKKAYKEVGAGDSSVNETELFFDIKCENTFQSMANLRNQPDASGQGFIYGKHVKENDHECLIGDVLILTDKGEIKIKDIKIGDMVLTRQGYKRVYDKWMTGIKDVYEYKIGNNKIVCTDNHKFYCVNENRFKEIKEFNEKDLFYTLRNREFLLNVSYVGKKGVYSISVEDVHEYFANNILVSNSDSARYAIHSWKMDNNIKSGGHYLLGKVI